MSSLCATDMGDHTGFTVQDIYIQDTRGTYRVLTLMLLVWRIGLEGFWSSSSHSEKGEKE